MNNDSKKKNGKKLKFVLLKERPMVGVALFYMIGIYMSIFLKIDSNIFRYLLFSSIAIVALLVYFKVKILSFILIISLSVGFLYSGIFIPNWYEEQNSIPSGKLKAKVVDIPIKYDDYVRLILDDLEIDLKEIEGKVQLGIYLKEEIDINIKDEISLEVMLEIPSTQQKDGWYDEKRALMTRGIRYKAFATSDMIQITNKDNAYENISQNIRNYVYKNIRLYTDDEKGGLVYAVLTGDKSYISDDIYNMFSRLGISHLLATSGLHIGILVLAWVWICRRKKWPLFVKISGSFLLIITLIILTGARISIIRASIMWIIIILNKFIGEDDDLFNSLAIACVIMLIFNPMWLIDIGFLLSISCIGALAVLSEQIGNIFGKYKNNPQIMIITASFSIILFVWPINARLFNYVSILSPIWNIIFIPLISFLLINTIVYSLLSQIPLVGWLLGYLLNTSAGITLFIGEMVSDFNYGISLVSPSFVVVILFLIATIILGDKILKGKLIKKLSISLIIVTIAITLMIIQQPKDRIEVFAGYNDTMVYIKSQGEEAIIINNSDSAIDSIAKKLNVKTFDKLIFTGNDIEDVIDIKDDLRFTSFDNIIVHKDIGEGIGDAIYINEMFASGTTIMVGDIAVEIIEFKANKTAIVHYCAKIYSSDKIFLYLDPMRAREGGFIGEYSVISSRWTKSRIKYIQYTNPDYIIMTSNDYLSTDSIISLDEEEILVYNINEDGSIIIS